MVFEASVGLAHVMCLVLRLPAASAGACASARAHICIVPASRALAGLEDLARRLPLAGAREGLASRAGASGARRHLEGRHHMVPRRHSHLGGDTANHPAPVRIFRQAVWSSLPASDVDRPCGIAKSVD